MTACLSVFLSNKRAGAGRGEGKSAVAHSGPLIVCCAPTVVCTHVVCVVLEDYSTVSFARGFGGGPQVFVIEVRD
jgi:hypothetical protein